MYTTEIRFSIDSFNFVQQWLCTLIIKVSTESRALMIDLFSAAFLSVREYFTDIGRPFFLWVNLNQLLFTHTLFQALKLSRKGVLRHLASATHNLGGYYYLNHSCFERFIKDLNTIMYRVCSRTVTITCVQYVPLSTYGLWNFLLSTGKIWTITNSTNLVFNINLSIYFLLIDISKGCNFNRTLKQHKLLILSGPNCF